MAGPRAVMHMSIEWRDDAPVDLTRLAVGRCMAAVLDASKWMEIGLLTDTLSQIEGHGRLLRSLSFGDDDYEGHVFDMTSRVLGELQPPPDPWSTAEPEPVPDNAKSRFTHLQTVTDFLDLPAWLALNDEAMFTRLFVTSEETATMPDGTVLSAADAAAARLQVGEMRRQIERIRRDHSDDPEAAIGQAKDLVETTCKTILGLTGDGGETKEDVPKLVKRTLIHLGLDPEAVTAAGGDAAEAHALKRLLGGVSSILTGAAELRNARGTGHGKSRAALVDEPLARLTVGLVLPAVVYLIEKYEENTAPTIRHPPLEARPAAGPCVGSIVRSGSFGEGQVLEVSGEGDKTVVTVDFGSSGAKRLLVRYVPLTVVTR